MTFPLSERHAQLGRALLNFTASAPACAALRSAVRTARGRAVVVDANSGVTKTVALTPRRALPICADRPDPLTKSSCSLRSERHVDRELYGFPLRCSFRIPRSNRKLSEGSVAAARLVTNCTTAYLPERRRSRARRNPASATQPGPPRRHVSPDYATRSRVDPAPCTSAQGLALVRARRTRSRRFCDSSRAPRPSVLSSRVSTPVRMRLCRKQSTPMPSRIEKRFSFSALAEVDAGVGEHAVDVAHQQANACGRRAKSSDEQLHHIVKPRRRPASAGHVRPKRRGQNNSAPAVVARRRHGALSGVRRHSSAPKKCASCPPRRRGTERIDPHSRVAQWPLKIA